MGAKRKTRSSPYSTTIPASSETRDQLAALNIMGGEESWEHLLRRAKAALEYVRNHPEITSKEALD